MGDLDRFLDAVCAAACSGDGGYLFHPITGPVADAVLYILQQEQHKFEQVLSVCDPATPDGLRTITGALGYVCSDGASWGRLTTLVAFVAHACRWTTSSARSEIRDALRQALGAQGAWITANGGPEAWAAFCRAVTVNSVEEERTLLQSALVAGVQVAAAIALGLAFIRRI